MTLDDLRALFDLPQIAAMSRVVREGESSQNDAAYSMRWPSKTFSGFSDHPRIFEPIPGSTLKSSAAGAYQITATTWDDLRRTYLFPDFSPASQDLACVALLYRRDAIAPLLAGDLETAIARCRQEWTSLPGAAENSRLTMARARAVFQQYGGVLASASDTQPAAPIVDADPAKRIIIEHEEDPTMAEPSFNLGATLKAAAWPAAKFNPLVGAGLGIAGLLVDVFSPLAKEKITKEMARHTDSPQVAAQFADGLIAAAQKLTAKEDPVQAIAAVRADPMIAAQLEQRAVIKLEQMLPLFDRLAQADAAAANAEIASADAAGERGRKDSYDILKLITWAAILFTAGILIAVFVLVGISAWKDTSGQPDTSLLMMALQIALFVVGVFGAIVAYRVGRLASNQTGAAIANTINSR